MEKERLPIEDLEEEVSGKSKNEFDSGLLAELLNTGENTEGSLQMDQDEEDKREPLFEEPDAKVKPKKITKKLGKYVDKFLFDMKKHPEKYMIETPEGLIPVTEALKRGYDPASKDFTDKAPAEEFEESLGDISPSSKDKIKMLTNPGNAGLPPGVAPEGMPQEEMPPEGATEQEAGIDPGLLAALGQGGM